MFLYYVGYFRHLRIHSPKALLNFIFTMVEKFLVIRLAFFSKVMNIYQKLMMIYNDLLSNATIGKIFQILKKSLSLYLRTSVPLKQKQFCTIVVNWRIS